MSSNKGVIEIPTEDLNEVLDAYRRIGKFLEHYVEPEMLYKNEFIKGMNHSLKEVSGKKTKKATNLKEFCS
jgi:hypothetical protein